MKLSHLISKLKSPFQILAGSEFIPQIEILDLTLDSRLAVPNSAFFAFLGSKNDGEKFIADAISLGAKAVFLPQNHHFNPANFVKKTSSNPLEIAHETAIFAGDNFAILVEFLEIFYKPQPSRIYGITGTNGKTSVAKYTRQILQIFGQNSASIGTLGVDCEANIASQLTTSSLTTPDLISLHKNLHLLKKAAIDDVAIEVSSIGLHQNRVEGLNIKVASFTNFTQDHLDYHGDMASYFAAKMLLFERVLDSQGVAVLNADIPEFLAIRKICEARSLRIIDYGRSATFLRLLEFQNQLLKFAFNGEIFEIQMAIEGEFQAYNMLCAIGNLLASQICEGFGLEFKKDFIKKFRDNLPKFSQISAAQGRLQKIAELPNQAKIFVDFAHSPDAIINVLKAARQISKARTLILFGCGGDRDAKKRPIMGKIASELADFAIITDDNPRTESPAQIRREILSEIDEKLAEKCLEIPDRKNAIHAAISMLAPNDILILAGKGHEKYQIIGTEKFPFDEEKIVADAIR